MPLRLGLGRDDIERLLERDIRAGAPISAAGLRRAIALAIEANNRALQEDLLALVAWLRAEGRQDKGDPP